MKKKSKNYNISPTIFFVNEKITFLHASPQQPLTPYRYFPVYVHPLPHSVVVVEALLPFFAVVDVVLQ
jgi:hypothetical protein